MSRLRRALLKLYLRLHEDYHHLVVYWLSRDDFGGHHPKNIFTFRSEFFVEQARPQDRVLDIACGTGTILHAMSDRIAYGLGIDSNAQSIELAQKLQTPNLEFKVQDIFNDSVITLVAQKSVNTGVLSHILEHIQNPVSYLRKLALPRLLICVPSQESWYKQLLKALGLRYLSDVTHFREYTRAMLRQELQEAGYSVVSIGFNGEGEIVCEAVKS